ncbi:hypothetical protein YC2023_102522 [Brassica napus]
MSKENVATRFSCVHGLRGHALIQHLYLGDLVSSTSFPNLSIWMCHVGILVVEEALALMIDASDKEVSSSLP